MATPSVGNDAIEKIVPTLFIYSKKRNTWRNVTLSGLVGVAFETFTETPEIEKFSPVDAFWYALVIFVILYIVDKLKEAFREANLEHEQRFADRLGGAIEIVRGIRALPPLSWRNEVGVAVRRLVDDYFPKASGFVIASPSRADSFEIENVESRIRCGCRVELNFERPRDRKRTLMIESDSVFWVCIVARRYSTLHQGFMCVSTVIAILLVIWYVSLDSYLQEDARLICLFVLGIGLLLRAVIRRAALKASQRYFPADRLELLLKDVDNLVSPLIFGVSDASEIG